MQACCHNTKKSQRLDLRCSSWRLFCQNIVRLHIKTQNLILARHWSSWDV